MKTSKIVMTLIISLAAASAFAGQNGNGTAGSAGGANGGTGVASDLGYYPGWQTANPVRVAEEAAKYPQAPSERSARAEWPTWVHVASN